MPVTEFSHESIALDQRHAPHSFEYADAATREAATGFAAGDVGKFALDLDTFLLWVLIDHDPAAIWQSIGGDEEDPIAGAVGSGTPYASGATQIYQLPGLVIQSKLDNFVVATGTISYAPIYIQEQVTLISLAGEVVAGAAATRALAAALYATDSDFQPTDLILGGTFDASSTGVKTIAAGGGGIVLPPGRYLTGRQSNHATPTWRAARTPSQFLTLLTSDYQSTFTKAQSYAAFADPGVAWDTVATSANQTTHAIFLHLEP